MMSDIESRKRPGDSDVANENKRYNREAHNVNVKLLIPPSCAGAIMGKGGENISRLKQELSINIKISKLNDFYPGTQERVCLVSGKDVSSVMKALSFVLDKIYENDKNSQGNEHKVRFVIPNSTAGMIIGKEGSDIKKLKDLSGCSFLAISNKDKSSVQHERFLSIVGHEHEIEYVLTNVLDKIQSDPNHANNLNVTYNNNAADRNGSPGLFGSSPSAINANTKNLSPFNPNSPFASPVDTPSRGGGGFMGSSPPQGSGLNLKIVLNSQGSATKLSPPVISQLLDHIYTSLSGGQYMDKELRDVVSAVDTLANYGLIELGLSDQIHEPSPTWQQRSAGSMGRGAGIWANRK